MPVHPFSINTEQFNSNLATEKGISILYGVSVVKELREAYLGYPPGLPLGHKSSHWDHGHPKFDLA